MGSARHPTVLASACSAPRIFPNRELERLVRMRRKERAASGADQTGLTIARTVCRPTWASSGSGSVDG